jgi:hypothetical protein
MALFTILKYALAFFFGYAAFIMLGPVVMMTRYENPAWDTMPTWMLAFGDQQYGIWILFIIIIAAVIMFAAITEANRNRSLEA